MSCKNSFLTKRDFKGQKKIRAEILTLLKCWIQISIVLKIKRINSIFSQFVTNLVCEGHWTTAGPNVYI